MIKLATSHKLVEPEACAIQCGIAPTGCECGERGDLAIERSSAVASRPAIWAGDVRDARSEIDGARRLRARVTIQSGPSAGSPSGGLIHA